MSVVVTPKAEAPKAAPVEAMAPEAPVVEAKPEVKDEPLSPKFAALARQQKEIRRQQLELKAKEEALKAKELEYQTKYIPKDKLKTDPYAVLEEEGIPYDQIVNSALSQDPQAKALRALEQKIKAMEAQEQKKAEEARLNQEKQYEQAVNKVRTDVKLFLDKSNEFEIVKGTEEGPEAVVELIKSNFEETGNVMSIEEAVAQVEKYYLDEAMKLAKFEKIKKLLTPQEVAELKAETQAQKDPALKQPVKTLTHASTTAQAKPASWKERRERAIAAFKGQLT